MTLRAQTLSGLKWSAIDGLAGQGLQFATGVILARLLTPADFGLVGMLTFFIAISQTFTDSGFSQALIRKPACHQEDFNTAFYFNLAVGAICYAVLFTLAGYISRFFREPQLAALIRVLGLVLIINSFAIIHRTILSKAINFAVQAKISVVASAVSGAIAIGMAIMGYGVWSIVARTLIVQLIFTVLVWIHHKWRPSMVVSARSFRELVGFGWKLLAASLIDTAYRNINSLIIGKFFAAEQLGYYTRADEFQRIPSSNLVSIIGRVSYPALATIQHDVPRLKLAYRRVISMTMHVTFVLMIGMAATAHQIVVLLIGNAWLPAVPYLQLLCFSGMLYPLHALNLNMLNITGRSDLYLRLEIIKKILAIPTIVVGILFGIPWMLVGVIVNSFVAYFLNSYWSGFLIGYPVREQLKDILPSLCLALLMGIVVYGLGYSLHRTPTATVLAAQMVLGAGVVLGIAYLTRMKAHCAIISTLREGMAH